MAAAIPSADIAIHVEAFGRWWWEGLNACLPAAWRRALGRNEHVVLVVDRAIDGASPRRELEMSLTVPRDSEQRQGLLLIGDALVHRVTAQLPLTPTRELAHLACNEAQRHCPLPLEEAAFGYILVGRDFALRQQEVEFVFCRRSTIGQVESYAQDRGLTLDGACVDGPAGPVRLPDLIAVPRLRHWISRSQEAALLTATKIFASLVPSVGLAWLWLAVLSHSVAHKVDGLKANAAQAEIARQDFERAVKLAKVVNDETAATPAFAQLEAIAGLLPESAWLSQVDIQERLVTMSGEAREPSGLMKIFSASKNFAAPHFAGPLIRVQGQDREQFSLSMQVK